MPDGTMIYGFGSIAMSAGAVKAFVDRTNNTLADVDNTFKRMLGLGWEGAAADSFHALSAQWNASADQMAATLAQMGVKVGTAGEQMQTIEGQAAALFAG